MGSSSGQGNGEGRCYGTGPLHRLKAAGTQKRNGVRTTRVLRPVSCTADPQRPTLCWSASPAGMATTTTGRCRRTRNSSGAARCSPTPEGQPQARQAATARNTRPSLETRPARGRWAQVSASPAQCTWRSAARRTQKRKAAFGRLDSSNVARYARDAQEMRHLSPLKFRTPPHWLEMCFPGAPRLPGPRARPAASGTTRTRPRRCRATPPRAG